MANVIRQPCDEGVIRSKEPRSPCAPNAAPWILAATILGSSMAFIDEAFVSGYRVVMVVAAATALASAISAALLIEGKKRKVVTKVGSAVPWLGERELKAPNRPQTNFHEKASLVKGDVATATTMRFAATRVMLPSAVNTL